MYAHLMKLTKKVLQGYIYEGWGAGTNNKVHIQEAHTQPQEVQYGHILEASVINYQR